MPKQARDYVVSSGNVFADLGIANPEEALAKAELAHKIAELIRTRKLTQKEAAAALGVSQPYLSQLEMGQRPVTADLAHAATTLYRLPATALPIPEAPSQGHVADAAQLARQLDGDVECRLLGRERVGLAERHQDRPAALVRDDVIRELHHGPTSRCPRRQWRAPARRSTAERRDGWRRVTPVFQNERVKVKCSG